jgi:hypothetical protein
VGVSLSSCSTNGCSVSKGHRWGNSHDGERVICINCECSPMSTDAKERCDVEALFPPAKAQESEPF